jgi:REP element-mobilizing transposase RayT
MTLRRTPHAPYDTKYHLVWTPKYRRRVDRKDIRSRIEELFQEIALNHQMEIDRIEVSTDHIHVFLLKKPPPVVGELHSTNTSIKIIILVEGSFRAFNQILVD